MGLEDAATAGGKARFPNKNREAQLKFCRTPMPQEASLSGFSHHPYQSSHPGNTRLDLNIASRDNLSSFTQRVMSAKLLRLKQLQNQLSEAHLQLNELCTENRLLRALQKRQDLALDRYEGTQAQLPQLVRSHQEEVRVLRTKYKNLKQQYRSVTSTLKEREAELQNLKEQHAHLLKLSKDRNLGEREALTKQLNELKLTVETQANTIQGLNRKVLLETKNYKFQLHQEMQRRKTTQSELQQAYLKLDQLQVQSDQAKERNVLPSSLDRLSKTSCHRLPGSQKSLRVINVEKDPTPNLKKPSRLNANAILVSTSNTGSSSVQLDSSPVTSSDKTNEFSTSFDSSPEHSSNKVDANDNIPIPELMSDSYQFHKTILQKSGTDFGLKSEASLSKKNSESSKLMGSLSTDLLDKEYANAVAMLTELSTKHNSNFTDGITTSLDYLDSSSPKHVASVASTALSSKPEPLPLFNLDLMAQDLFSTSPIKNKKEGPSGIQSLYHKEKSDDMGSHGDTPETLTKPAEDVVTDEPFIHKNQQTFDQTDDTQKFVKTTGEMIEASRKEALLKALKAIDDRTSDGHDSDECDLDVIKIPPRDVSTRRFSSSVASRRPIEPDIRGKPCS